MLVRVHSVYFVHTFLVLEAEKKMQYLEKNHLLGPVGYAIANVALYVTFTATRSH